MGLPLDIRDLVTSGSKLRAEREKPVRIAVLVDVEAPEALVDALKEALRPQMSTASLSVVVVVPGEPTSTDTTADVVIAAAGDAATLEGPLANARGSFVPCAVLGLGHDKAELSGRVSHPVLDTIVSDDPAEMIDTLGGWLGDRVTGKRLALAANFPFVRRAVAEESVKNTSFQNAVIGGVVVIPGADMPLMTANQAKMILQIAAAYGEPLGAERIKELAAVVGGAFVLRTVARQALAFVPGLGWAIKAGIGYSGTLAMGYAAIEYFEAGGDVSGLADRLRETRDRVLSAAARRRRSGASEEPIPAHAWVQEPEVLPELSDGADSSVPGDSSDAPSEVL